MSDDKKVENVVSKKLLEKRRSVVKLGELLIMVQLASYLLNDGTTEYEIKTYNSNTSECKNIFMMKDQIIESIMKTEEFSLAELFENIKPTIHHLWVEEEEERGEEVVVEEEEEVKDENLSLEERVERYRILGNKLFAEGEYVKSGEEYRKALALSPSNPILLLNMSSVHLHTSKFHQAVQDAKKSISEIRKLLSSPPTYSSSFSDPLKDKDPSLLIAKAYIRAARGFHARGMDTRSKACLLLSLKEKRTEEAKLELARVREASSSNPSISSRTFNSGDIEDLVSAHKLLSAEDDLEFSCNMCGNCCRETDQLPLHPYDIFLMIRSPNLPTVSSTSQLISLFAPKKTFQFTRVKGLFPIWYLSPIKSENGRCHFSYPLYRATKEKEDNEIGNDIENEKGYMGTKGILNYQEVVRYGLLDEYTRVDPTEYNLTEEVCLVCVF